MTQGQGGGCLRGAAEHGYAMAVLLTAIAVMTVLRSATMPVWRQLVQREREEELIFRGEQSARAVSLFQRKYGGGLPPSVDVLVEQRLLRKKYADPMTPDGAFQVLYQSSLARTPGQPTGPGTTPATPAPGAGPGPDSPAPRLQPGGRPSLVPLAPLRVRDRICRFSGEKLPGPALRVIGTDRNWLARRKYHQFSNRSAAVDARLLDGSVGATPTREVFSETAELVQNRIRMTTAGRYLKQNLTKRASVEGRYHDKSFSDGNHAKDLHWSTPYALYSKPHIVIGHRFRLLDFHKQSGSAYFDPDNSIANRGFASVYFENSGYYADVEKVLGYESYRHYGVVSDNFIHGGAGSTGIKPLQNLSLEINVERSNFAADSTSGFNYFNIGPRILWRF